MKKNSWYQTTHSVCQSGAESDGSEISPPSNPAELSSTDSDSERPEHPKPMDSPLSPVVLPPETLHHYGVSPGMLKFLISKL